MRKEELQFQLNSSFRGVVFSTIPLLTSFLPTNQPIIIFASLQYNLEFFIMVQIPFYSFVGLTQTKTKETLDRKIDMILRRGEIPFPPHYALIRSGISRFCSTGFNPDVLDDMHEHVITSVTTSEFTMKDKPNCLLAIELMRSMPIPILKGGSFEKGERIDLPICGICLRVVTDATLSWVDANGNRHIGAIKAKVKKGVFSRESSEMTACLVAEALKVKYPDAIVDPLHCYCFDVFRQRLIPASNMSRNLEVANEIAEMIASRGDLAA